MIDASRLLKDLKRLLKTLEADVRARLDDNPEVRISLEQEWKDARAAGRTARTLEDWLDEEITQAAVHWILGIVFLRFIEDNGLVERPWLSGPVERLALARDRYEAFFREHPTLSDREYLQSCFRDAEALPGVKALFDERHNPLWRVEISGDGAAALIQFCQRIDPDRGELDHDFGGLDTRFLGDLYQDLSDAAKKRYALLQTPEFVERFILDRTLLPAIAEFGYRSVQLIDPACGSGHFLIDTFRRLFDMRVRNQPNLPLPSIAQAALDQIAGVDINPFAVGIARFRLLVTTLEACGIKRLQAAPDFRISVATGDSLLHGRQFTQLDLKGDTYVSRDQDVRHVYATEDRDDLTKLLGQQYHVVVGNPPYITPKDPGLNQAYRERYATCHMKYALVVPFVERFFDLAFSGDNGAGYIGMIVGNSFMKREFGKKLIEEFLPKLDLTHIVDTAGAYIPGHGTPTAILFGRHRAPVGSTIRTVMGIKGEPSTPADPSQGQVWQAILRQIDQAGSESEFVSAADMSRAAFAKHPWSIGGGGAAELKEAIEEIATRQLVSKIWIRRYQVSIGDRLVTRENEEIGISAVTGEDDCYLRDSPRDFVRIGVEPVYPLLIGDAVRDWMESGTMTAIWPYSAKLELRALAEIPHIAAYLWNYKSLISRRRRFGVPMLQRGLTWYEFQELYRSKLETPLSLTFAFVATHNHFALDHGGKLFNRSAPVIKLPPGASEDDHLAILGLLNSSTACFWMKQTFYPKGGDHLGQEGARVRKTFWDERFEFTATGLLSFPLVEPYPTDLARELDRLSQSLTATLPSTLLAHTIPSRVELDAARQQVLSLRRTMIALQEELDWRCYHLYGLLDERIEHLALPELGFGQRPFEIAMARQIAVGTLETTWFDRHGSKPTTELPVHWPGDYRKIVERRLALIEHNKWINLIERPENKRRWQWKPWHEQEHEALKSWLCDRLEDARFWLPPPTILSVYQLAERARDNAEFLAAGALYTGHPDFDVTSLVADLVEAESVPFLPVLRYTPDGLRKRAVWERVWDMQRLEDAGQKIDEIPPPPKYKQSDFQKNDFWRLRGGLDVPKERFISYPGAARDADGSLPVAWAGYDHQKQAQAFWQYYEDRKLNDGWTSERLIPLLAGLNDLLPWLKQWHNERDAVTGTRFGDFMAELVAEEARGSGLTPDQLRAWSPPAINARGRHRKKKVQVDTIATEDSH